ncbi:MAG: phosphoribosyltransferase [Rhodospirillales bacterium]|nr:phosphoribosyltransferase [Rhodospirillales bacterium]
MFTDRREAGRLLAVQLNQFRAGRPLILALPRGGVPVGYEIAIALDAPLDVLVVQKLHAPGPAMLPMGTVVEGDPPESSVRQDVVDALGVPESAISAECGRQIVEIGRRQRLYRGVRQREDIADCTAIVVDDGIATGETIRAAIRAVRRANPRRLVVALPAAPSEILRKLQPEVDAMVCLVALDDVVAINVLYHSYPPVSDADVVELLHAAGSARRDTP